mmetsp:Transcript_44207/g.114862  ORF Transcript_44207/g.114862 Transcript_44207/m.114862 type:complete len:217 (+) Transcript_44207:668-1318(+)
MLCSLFFFLLLPHLFVPLLLCHRLREGAEGGGLLMHLAERLHIHQIPPRKHVLVQAVVAKVVIENVVNNEFDIGQVEYAHAERGSLHAVCEEEVSKVGKGRLQREKLTHCPFVSALDQREEHRYLLARHVLRHTELNQMVVYADQNGRFRVLLLVEHPQHNIFKAIFAVRVYQLLCCAQVYVFPKQRVGHFSIFSADSPPFFPTSVHLSLLPFLPA